MSTKIEEGITQGLLAGYGGNTQFTTVSRGDFELKSSTFRSGNITYIDQWLPRDTGGGQELVRIDEEEFTRLYAGGVAKQEKLNQLGISSKDVIGKLIGFISDAGTRTRLFSGYSTVSDDWSYDYFLMESEEDIPVSAAKESIRYQGKLVFVHYFLLCPIT